MNIEVVMEGGVVLLKGWWKLQRWEKCIFSVFSNGCLCFRAGLIMSGRLDTIRSDGEFGKA